jgi:hypothetical protein
MSNAFGRSNKSTGRSASIDKHPASNPEGTSDEPFSQMAMVDTKEHHAKTLDNMAETPGHVKSIPITDHHAYKRQSHAVKPSGPIESFVSEKADISKKPKVLKPQDSTGYYKGKKDY